MNYLKKARDLYKGKKILVLGLGLNQGGVGVVRFFAKVGSLVRVTDLKTEKELKSSLDELCTFPSITYHLGKHQFSDIDWADIVVRNPAIRPNNEFLQYALSEGKEIEMELSIFLKFVDPKQLIGVTGTKGKSTTASLIYECLKENPNVLLAGNIGKSMLDVIPVIHNSSLVILELSSFQLQALNQVKLSPKYAVITNIFPDHLNYHQDMKEYIQLKKEVALYQTADDYLFLNRDNEITGSIKFIKGLKGRPVYFSSTDLPANFLPRLPGDHNRSNFASALAIAKIFQVPTSSVLEIMEKFTGMEYRLQLVRVINKVKFYNDSAATNPQAAIEAIKTLPHSIVITGGMNKGLSYFELAKTLDSLAKKVYLIDGDATEELKVHMQNQDKIMGTYSNLIDLLTDVLRSTEPNDKVLFTPGATSFNLWQNEFDRGRQYNLSLERAAKR